MGIPDSQWGEDDPDYCAADNDAALQEEFETARFMGMKPEDMLDKAFAAQYEAWLKTAPHEEERPR